MNNHTQIIALEGQLLELDETVRNIECPACEALGTLAITRVEEGFLYCCHRARCSFEGLVPTRQPLPIGSGTATLVPTKERKVFEPKYFTRPLMSLTNDMRVVIQHKYDLSFSEVEYNRWRWDYTQGRIHMPIFERETGRQIGAQCKALTNQTPKVLNYLWEPSIKLHFPLSVTYTPNSPIVLVEDIISSIKVRRYTNCCALLGTNLNIDQIKYLRKITNHIIFMLDPDAQDKAIELKQEFGLYFARCDILTLNKDPKDTPTEVLNELLSFGKNA